MACDECRSYFAHPALLTLGRERTAEEELLMARLPEVWEVLRSWRENPTSGLYVERLALRCRSCGQRAETSDDAWYGGEFSPIGGH
jgi:hypothetical protein